MNLSPVDAVVVFIGGVIATALIQWFFRRTIGTNYRTQNQCDECSVRASMAVIKTLVVELAIKAGVPAHEVAKVVSQIGSKEGA